MNPPSPAPLPPPLERRARLLRKIPHLLVLAALSGLVACATPAVPPAKPSLYMEGAACASPPYHAFGEFSFPDTRKNIATRQIWVSIPGQLHEIFFPAAAVADLFNLDPKSSEFSTHRGRTVLKMRGSGDYEYGVTFAMSKTALLSRSVSAGDRQQTLLFR